MSPVRVNHALFTDELQTLLKKFLPQGRTAPEFPVDTKDNTKAPDVIWISKERLQQAINQTSSPIAPEICIEVASPNDSKKKLVKKFKLYFQAGAVECWICDEEGKMHFFVPEGELESSNLVPNFPKVIEL